MRKPTICIKLCIAFVAYIQLAKLTGSSSITAVFMFAEYKALLLCYAYVHKDFLQHVILGYQATFGTYRRIAEQSLLLLLLQRVINKQQLE